MSTQNTDEATPTTSLDLNVRNILKLLSRFKMINGNCLTGQRKNNLHSKQLQGTVGSESDRWSVIEGEEQPNLRNKYHLLAFLSSETNAADTY